MRTRRRREGPAVPQRSTRTASGLPTLARLRRVIAQVPRGKVITYGQVASAAGFPRAARLTVWALQRGEELPWHRVVAAGGRIALPAQEGAEQRLRLKLEGVTFRNGRVRMDRHNWTPRSPRYSSPSPPPPSRRPREGRRPPPDFPFLEPVAPSPRPRSAM